jgi:hypothetical protein
METKDFGKDKEKKTIKQPIKPVEKKVEKKVEITFRENRKFDLHVHREMMIFRGRETKSISKAWLEHKDFKQVEKYFIIKEV